MSTRDSLKHQLIDAIKRPLARDDALLTPIVQSAAHLALICQNHYYDMLFRSHINGSLPRGDQLAPPFQDVALREKVLKDFQSDRLWSTTICGGPLQHIEEQLQQIKKQMKENPPGEPLFSDGMIGFTHVLISIRERVETFIAEVENPPTDLARTVEAVGEVSPLKREGRVFIGHGRSPAWLELEKFLQNRLGLQTDEFNRESPAGITTVERLRGMLASASFAFLVMTAEDQHADETFHARENVIHEIGLFQGRLEFEKAIILLEEGCAEFSNIHGLSHISFPKGNIVAKLEEIRRVLEREGILSPGISKI